MSDTISLLYTIIFIIILWCLDDMLLYSIVSIISTLITIDILNSVNGFMTISPVMRTSFAIIWIFLTLIAWSKTYRLAKKAKGRYEYKIEQEEL